MDAQARSADADASTYRQLIDGKMETSPSSFEVVNTSTAEPFARCPDASRDQLDRAVAAARRAFPAWAATPIGERQAMIHKLAAKLRENVDKIAPVLTREQGKPLAQATGEIMFGAMHLEGLSSIPLDHELIRDDGKTRIELRHRPLGVVGGITPWNFPVALAMHKLAQALYTGNTLVLKSSPYTPLSTAMTAELACAIFPPGVVNILAGGNELGQWMTEHPGIDKITFTGSIPTGKRVMASAANQMKRVTLELGGNDAAIVLDDADIPSAAAGIFNGAFGNCGQICGAIKRVYVPERLYEPLLEGLAEHARAHKVGDGFDDGVQMGPLQNKMQYDKVLNYLEDARNRPGARVVVGGHKLNRPGYFLAPTVVAGLDDDAPLVREEQFGPVLPVLKYTDVEDAIRRANDTSFGLSGSVWGADEDRAEEVAARLEAGGVSVNRAPGLDADVPFGGAKESGLGREHGLMGLRAYMEPQVVTRRSTSAPAAA